MLPAPRDARETVAEKPEGKSYTARPQTVLRRAQSAAPVGGGRSSGSEATMARDFCTTSEVAKLLRVPPRRILELLDAGEIEAERDPRTGRWRVPKASLNASETERLTELLTEGEDELRARLRTTDEALLALEERARALREELDRVGEERDHLRAELEAERSKGFWRRMFGG